MPEKTLLRKRNQQLLQLACSEAMHSGNFHKFLHEVVQISSETLDVERVGVWFYNSDHSKIFCECLYERGTGKFTKGFDLSARQYPQYFKALAERRAIVADDAQHDKDTQEFTENYLKKFDIRSMLDAPIRRTRGVVGIVCHEHIGSARHWTAEEEQFAATISDFITMALQERERKTAVEALHHSEEKFFIAFNLNPCSIILTSIPDGRVMEANESMLKILGYSRQEVIGKTTEELGIWVSLQDRQRYLAEAVQFKRVQSFRSKFYNRNREILTGIISAECIQVQNKPHLLAVIQNITELEKINTELKFTEEKFQKAFQSSPTPVLISTIEDGTMLEVNESFLRETGWSREEVIGHTSLELKLWANHETRTAFTELLKKDGRVYNFQADFLGKDGKIILGLASSEIIDFSGTPCIISSVLVITELIQTQKRLESALMEVERLKDKLEAENTYLQEEIRQTNHLDGIVGKSAAMMKVLSQVESIAKTDATVLILGETGTGKELIARAIHALSRRKQRPLVKVNCGAIPSTLVDSELFGHEKGAFTGALNRREGRFELADGGTLFLDEVGELPLDTQIRLLRVLQEREFERVGGNMTIKVDVHVIAATNRNLEEEIQRGAFRSDLFYRLNVIPIHIPPLRERKEDIPLLVDFYIKFFSQKLNRKDANLSPKTLSWMMDYSWPGNIRELQNLIERALVISVSDVIDIQPLKTTIPRKITTDSSTLDDLQKKHILETLEKTNWVIDGASGAAALLDIHPNTLRSRMKKLAIKRPANL